MSYMGVVRPTIALTSSDIADDAVITAKINDDAVTAAKIATDAVDTAEIAADAVEASELADDAVDTAAVADNAVTLAKMAGLVRGKIIYGDASGDPAALTVGTANYVLTSDGTDIAWAAASGNDVAFQVGLSGDLTLTDDANIKIPWDTEQFDVGGVFASNKFTVPAGGGGNYLFYAQGTVDGIGQDNIQSSAIKIYKNGGAVAGSTNQLPKESDIMMNVSVGLSLVATDYIEVYAALNSVNGSDGRVPSGDSALFWGFKLA